MSKASINQVIQRAVSDAAFRRQLQHDPASALAGFDLTADERAAITGGDPARLTSLGVDQRMSKAFAIGGLSSSASAVIELDPGKEHGRGIIGDPTAATSAVVDGDTASPGLHAFDAGAPTGGNAVIDPLTASGNDWLIDPAQTGGVAGVTDTDSGASAATLDEPARDMGGDVHPTEY